MSSAISPISAMTGTDAASQTAASTNASVASTDALGNEDTFLQLLVAQIKNQDPTQPIDSTTFLTQLASFSQLEQLIGIRQDVSQLDPAAAASGSTQTSSTTGS
jgi:flagellar basal-body rod modification protein FlgD